MGPIWGQCSSVLVNVARRRRAGPRRLQTVLRIALLLDWASYFGHLTGILCPERMIVVLVGIGTLQHFRLVCGPLLVSKEKVPHGLIFFAKIGLFLYNKRQNFFQFHKKPPLSFSGDSCLINILIKTFPF